MGIPRGRAEVSLPTPPQMSLLKKYLFYLHQTLDTVQGLETETWDTVVWNPP